MRPGIQVGKKGLVDWIVREAIVRAKQENQELIVESSLDKN